MLRIRSDISVGLSVDSFPSINKLRICVPIGPYLSRHSSSVERADLSSQEKIAHSSTVLKLV